MKTFVLNAHRKLALMGGAYGNLPALDAALADAREQGCEALVFLGDATGCCGHSAETLVRVREHFDVIIAGNHEQEVAAGSDHCACGYSDPEDERLGCLAHQYALQSVTVEQQAWLAELPERAVLEVAGQRWLLCHGSPARINEFLYESELDEARLGAWLADYDCQGLACTHTGLPWVRRLDRGIALNCGVIGKPDHDGDPAVHYAVVSFGEGRTEASIRRVEYDHENWARQLEAEGVDPVFVEPLRTGWWSTGANSLPDWERYRRAR